MNFKRASIFRMITFMMLAIFIAGIQPLAGQQNCQTWPTSEVDHKILGMAIDNYISTSPRNWACLNEYYNYDWNGDIFKVLQQLSANDDKSWNKPPLSWLNNYFYDGDSTSKTRLKDYAVNQLTSAYGLWGKEPYSWLYWDVVPACAVAFQEITDPAVRSPMQKLMQAHVGVLSIFSTGSRVYTPSTRTHPGSSPSDASRGQDYFLKKALGLNPAFPVGRNNEANWAFFITEKLTHNYMSTTIRDKYKTCYQNGSNIDWVIAKLNALGVYSKTPISVWRYMNGNYGVMMEKNVNHSKSTQYPYYAVSKVGSTVQLVGGYNSYSTPECSRIVINGIPYFKTSQQQVRAPMGTLIYKVVIDQGGVRREYVD
jgi:hypothetical protein